MVGKSLCHQLCWRQPINVCVPPEQRKQELSVGEGFGAGAAEGSSVIP